MSDPLADILDKVPSLRPNMFERSTVVRLVRYKGQWNWSRDGNPEMWVHPDVAHAFIERNMAEWLSRRHIYIERTMYGGFVAMWPPTDWAEPDFRWIGSTKSPTYGECLRLAVEAVAGMEPDDA